jgi:repressor LexA
LAYASRPLTKKQVRLLVFIDTYLRTFGYAPSFEEIAQHFGYASLATVHEHVTTLERKGVIQRTYNAARGIRVLVRPDELDRPKLEVTP